MALDSPGKRLAYLRRVAEMTQDEVAEKTGYSSYTSVQQYESGARKIGLKAARKFAELFGVAPDFILGIPEKVYFDPGYTCPELSLLKLFCELRAVPIAFHALRIDKENAPGLLIPLQDITEMDLSESFANAKSESGEIIPVSIKRVTIGNNDPVPFYYFAACFFRILQSFENELDCMSSNYAVFLSIYGKTMGKIPPLYFDPNSDPNSDPI